MTFHHLAFFMGLFGSLHCAVMCGPLVLAVQGNQSFSLKNSVNKVLYQAGRLLVYGLLGLFISLLGNVAALKGWQQGFSIVTGIVLLALGIFHYVGKQSGALASFQTKAIQPFVKQMSLWLFRPGGSFIAGMLNGVLPCGMVYMALFSAMNADSIVNGFLFMLLFGLGTLPLMLVFSFASFVPKRFLKVQFSRIIPVLYMTMGIWFVLRGANLNIPFLSPLLHVDGALHCA